MPHLPTVAAARAGVRTAAELRSAGWTTDAVRHAVERGWLTRIAPGRFAPAPPPDLDRFRRADLELLRRAVAATLPGDRAAVSHLAGALLRDWPVWALHPRPCVTTWDARVCRLAGIHVHRVADLAAFVRRGGVAVTSPARTIVDIAREFGTEAALVPGSFALRHGQVSRAALQAEIDRRPGLAGTAAARAAVPLLDPLTESPLESRSRWHFDVHEITPPASQVEIHHVGGAFLGRVDCFWDEGVVGEVDGATQYRADESALVREKRRQQRLEDQGLEVVRWGADDLLDFRAAAARIARAWARARSRAGERQWFAVPTDPTA